MPSCTSGHHLIPSLKGEPTNDKDKLAVAVMMLLCTSQHTHYITLYIIITFVTSYDYVRFILSMCSLQDLLASYSLVVRVS